MNSEDELVWLVGLLGDRGKKNGTLNRDGI